MDAWRRDLHRKLLTLPMLGAWLSLLPSAKAQGALQATPSEPAGPYYPRDWPSQSNQNLLNMQGRIYSKGTPLKLSGRVLSTNGQALAARAELWQSDESGLYRHPRGDGEGPAQRGFHGFGWVQTAADGVYSFRGIRPVPYGGRPAHIHMKVSSPGHRSLTTQLYLARENAEAIWLYRTFGGFSKARDRLTIDPQPWQDVDINRAAWQANFDFVLEPT
jgi:protocatechuate 3,4-dioxygenase, beta subunit